MCGIAGFNWKDESLIKKMTHVIEHRGPDDEGFYVDDNISLGHRRLSIIDLSDRASQPMIYQDFTIVFNGEIYNYNEIKKQLQHKGHIFKTTSDTEVILHAYQQWGENCVAKFNGMWALCIFDKKKNRFFISRDRFGIKPLYYFHKAQRFVFASEIHSITQHNIDLDIDKNALNFFFYQKYVGNDLSIYSGIRKLLPSHNLIYYPESGELLVKRYYSLENEINNHKTKSVTELRNEIQSHLIQAVNRRLIADVPVGSFLSGGLDSSVISAIIAGHTKHFKTFSIGFKQKSYNELPWSVLVSEIIKTDHFVDMLDIDDHLIENVITRLDEPFGDSSILPTYLLSKLTRQHVTVSLSGDAGDEVFGGYDTYLAHKLAKLVPGFSVNVLKQLMKIIPYSDKKVSLSFKIRRFIRDFPNAPVCRHLNWMATYIESNRKSLLPNAYVPFDNFMKINEGNSLRTIQLNDIDNYLPGDILKKVDLSTMMNSLEARVPFLDHNLVPRALALPDEKRISGLRNTKFMLKGIAKNYLPKEVINRKKRGFTVPVASFIRESTLIKEFLYGKSYFNHGYVDYNYVQNLMKQHVENKIDYARELWLVFVLNFWMNKK